MAPDGAELLIGVIAAVALLLLPLASRLIADVGSEISAELDGGRTGASLARHLDRQYAARVEAARQAAAEGTAQDRTG